MGSKLQLPPISALRKRCQALAALDLIFSPDWEYRYFSFNAAWTPGEQMASMRNGSGDEWFCLFHRDQWAALKGLDHESIAWAKGGHKMVAGLREALPPALAAFGNEPAFRWDETSFAFYCLGERQPWIRAGNKTPFADLPSGEVERLSLVTGSPQDYIQHVAEYFEREIDVDDVASIFSHAPITRETALSLNPEIEWTDIKHELVTEIGFPVAS